MKASPSIGYVAASQPLTARVVLDTWRAVTPAQIKGAFLFGCALFGYHSIVFSNFLLTKGIPVGSLISGFLLEQFAAFTLLLGIVVADRVTGPVFGRRMVYMAAVALSAFVLAMVGHLAVAALEEPTIMSSGVLQDVIYSFFEWLVLGGAATFIYTDRRRANAALARMRNAEIERARAAKRTLESRLQAMQARVEPQFLFNTLAQVKQLYELDPVSAERMLDELIAYLRAAMPKMRDTSSSVSQEIELARAYLAIVKVRLGERLSYEVESPSPEVSAARMPPMMLLPLIDLAITRGLAESQSTGWLRVDVTLAAGRMRIEIITGAMGFAPAEEGVEIASLRERLSAIYGSAAACTLEAREPGSVAAVLEIPREEFSELPDQTP